MGGLEDMAALTGGAFSYQGGLDGGRIVASGAGVCRLPDVAVGGVAQTTRLLAPRGGVGGRWLVVLMPWVKYGDGRHGGVVWDGEWYSADYEYPLDSGCLVREWRRDSVGAWSCGCEPSAGCGLADDNGFVSVCLAVEGEKATASVKIGDDTLWTGSAVFAAIAERFLNGEE